MFVQADRIPGQLTGAVHDAGMQEEAVGLVSFRQDQQFPVRRGTEAFPASGRGYQGLPFGDFDAHPPVPHRFCQGDGFQNQDIGPVVLHIHPQRFVVVLPLEGKVDKVDGKVTGAEGPVFLDGTGRHHQDKDYRSNSFHVSHATSFIWAPVRRSGRTGDLLRLRVRNGSGGVIRERNGLVKSQRCLYQALSHCCIFR